MRATRATRPLSLRTRRLLRPPMQPPQAAATPAKAACFLAVLVGTCWSSAAVGPEDYAVARAAAEVLGISPAANQREVAAAFRRGSFRVHPEADNASPDSGQPGPRNTYETLCEAALALSALQSEKSLNPVACAAAKPSSLAVTELLLAAQRGDTDTALAVMRGSCFTPAWIEARDVRCMDSLEKLLVPGVV